MAHTFFERILSALKTLVMINTVNRYHTEESILNKKEVNLEWCLYRFLVQIYKFLWLLQELLSTDRNRSSLDNSRKNIYNILQKLFVLKTFKFILKQLDNLHSFSGYEL